LIRIILTAISILSCYLLQSSVFPHFELANVVPDVLLVLVICAGYTKGKYYGMFTGFFSGLLVDLCIGTYIGYMAALYMFVGYLAGFAYKIYDSEDYTLPVFIIAIGDFIYQNLYYMLSFALRGKLNYAFYLGRFIMPKVVYTVAVGIFVFIIANWVHCLLMKIEKE